MKTRDFSNNPSQESDTKRASGFEENEMQNRKIFGGESEFLRGKDEN